MHHEREKKGGEVGRAECIQFLKEELVANKGSHAGR